MHQDALAFLFLAVSEHEIEFFSISSKYEEKSDYIKAQYFEIKNWQEIGLNKPSWIDIGSRRRVLIDDVDFDFMGTLPVIAIQALEQFIINYNNFVIGSCLLFNE